VRRRQVIKTKKRKIKPIAHKVRRQMAKRKGKDTWSAKDLSLPNRTIKHRCVAYKETGFLALMYVDPNNKRGLTLMKSEGIYTTADDGTQIELMKPGVYIWQRLNMQSHKEARNALRKEKKKRARFKEMIDALWTRSTCSDYLPSESIEVNIKI
jgi:hypothetical protein